MPDSRFDYATARGHNAPMRVLLVLPLVALAAAAAAQDFAADVERACTSKRLGIKIAASNKVAGGGAPAAAAVRAYAKAHGANALSDTLVGALANNPKKSDEAIELLLEWARDKDFYWRSQALSGLARADNPRLLELRVLFVAGVGDPAQPYRIQAARGLIALATTADRERVRGLLRDPDARVRRSVAEQLADTGDRSGLPVLVQALAGGELEFLGDPWGRREARSAFEALKRATGQSFGYDPDLGAAANREAIEAFAKLAGLPAPASRPTSAPDRLEIGIEVRSCKHGDLFVRWNDAGSVAFGLEGDSRAQLDAAAAEELARLRKALAPRPDATIGAVVCDFLRYRGRDPDLHWKCAPLALPEDLTHLLKALADRLERSKNEDCADQLRTRLRQFAPEDDK